MKNSARGLSRCNAVALILAVVLAAGVGGSTSFAFATGNERAEQSDAAARECAFMLGHVVISCVSLEVRGDSCEEPEDAMRAQTDGEALASALTVGEPQKRAYRITNEGEEAYVRLASHTLFEDLDHVNRLGVREEASANEAKGSEEAETSSDDERAAAGPSAEKVFWQLASDGFWYRSASLAPDESIVVELLVEIPDEEAWLEALGTGEANIVEETLNVEAMQARHNAVDLASERPWGESLHEASPTDTAVSEEEGGEKP